MKGVNQAVKTDVSRRSFLTTSAGATLAAAAGATVAGMPLSNTAMAGSHTEPSIVRDMTAANLRGAFGGESMAYMRYVLWANHAEKDEKPEIARLFRAIAESEKVHADNHFEEMGDHPGEELVASMAVFGLGSTSDNLQGGIDGEVFEVEEMYPAFLAVAKKQNEEGAIEAFEYALASEKAHIDLFEKAKEAADKGEDVDMDKIGVCDVCGYTIEGEIPDYCPVCGHSRNHFISFE